MNKKSGTFNGCNGPFDHISRVPSNIALEIIRYIEPNDALNMGRVSKSFRKLVSSSKFETCWKDYRANLIVTPPECPSDITEIAYAQLLYEKTCMICGKLEKDGSARTIWELRKTLCDACLLSISTLLGKEQGKTPDAIIADMFSIPKELAAVIPEYEAEYFAWKGDKFPQQKKFVSKNHALRWAKEYYAHKTPKEKTAWIKLEVKNQKAIKKHATKCSAWRQQFDEEYAAQHAKAVEERKSRIQKMLEDMGWGEELSNLKAAKAEDPLCQKKVMTACENELTDKVLEDMKLFLEGYMQHAKSSRLSRGNADSDDEGDNDDSDEYEKEERDTTHLQQFKAIYEEAFKAYPIYEPRPRLIDVYIINRIYRALADPPYEELSGEELGVTAETADALRVEVDKTINKELQGLVEWGLESKNFYNPETVLDLATTVFACDGDEYVKFERSSSNACFNTAEAILHPQSCRMLDNELEDLDGDIDLAWITFKTANWNKIGLIEFDRESHDELCKLMQLCGLNPHTTTVAEVNKINPMFECTSCNDKKLGRLVMAWSRVLPHKYDYHNRSSEKKPANMVLLEGKDAIEAQQQIQASIEKQWDLDPEEFSSPTCMHCKKQKESMKDMKKHLKKSHQISAPAVETDFKFAYRTERKPASGAPYMEAHMATLIA